MCFRKGWGADPRDINFSSLGTDGNDTIEYTEFLAVALDKRKVLKEDVVWEAFKVFDSDGSGTVSKKELCKILTGRTSDKIRQVHGEQAIEAFLDSYDTSDDGVIDFDEFLSMLSAGAETQGGGSQSARRKRIPSGIGLGFGATAGGFGKGILDKFCGTCATTERAKPSKEPIEAARNSRTSKRRSVSSKGRKAYPS